MWPFKKKRRNLVGVDCGMIDAMRAKDPELYERIAHKPVDMAWREWKDVHPEDFPQGEMSPVSAASIVITGSRDRDMAMLRKVQKARLNG